MTDKTQDKLLLTPEEIKKIEDAHRGKNWSDAEEIVIADLLKAQLAKALRLGSGQVQRARQDVCPACAGTGTKMHIGMGAINPKDEPCPTCQGKSQDRKKIIKILQKTYIEAIRQADVDYTYDPNPDADEIIAIIGKEE